MFIKLKDITDLIITELVIDERDSPFFYEDIITYDLE